MNRKVHGGCVEKRFLFKHAHEAEIVWRGVSDGVIFELWICQLLCRTLKSNPIMHKAVNLIVLGLWEFPGVWVSVV